MNKIKSSHILFSLALIVALALALVPAAPAHALSSSAGQAVTIANQVEGTSLSPGPGVVCRRIAVWRNGHRTFIRRCHKAARPGS